MLGADQACACFPAGRDARRAARNALAGLREVESGLARLAETLEDHWKVAVHTRMVAHIGPILIDPAILAAPDSRMPAVVGRAIDGIDRARAVAGAERIVVSVDLLEMAGEPAGDWGRAVDADDLSFRFPREKPLETRAN